MACWCIQVHSMSPIAKIRFLCIFAHLLSQSWHQGNRNPKLFLKATPGIGSTAVQHASILFFCLSQSRFSVAWHGLGHENQQQAQRPASASQRCENSVSTRLNANTLKTVATSRDSSDQPISTPLDTVKANSGPETWVNWTAGRWTHSAKCWS